MKKFMFGADAGKAFRKLANHQLGNPSRWVWEVLANALDAQGEAPEPVGVLLERMGDRARLVVTDAGEGLDAAGVEALFFIGRTTKRMQKGKAIGRFGFGFLSVFSIASMMRSVVIEGRFEGEPIRIVYDCRGRDLPLWHVEAVVAAQVPERGCRFVFEFAIDRYAAVAEEIRGFCERTVVPVRYRDQVHVHKPEDLLSGGGGVLVHHAGEGVDVHLASSYSGEHRTGRDHVEINVRRMPAHEGSAHRLFTSASDKMIQNSYGNVYLPDEEILVVTTIGEPTVGRDALVRDAEFDRIADAVQFARAKALARLLAIGAQRRQSETDTVGVVLANLYTLRSDVAAFLENRLEAKRAYLAGAIEALVRVPAFRVHGGRRRVSARELYADAAPHRVHLHAETEDVAGQFDHTCPFVLDSAAPLPVGLTGWHTVDQTKDVAGSLLSYCKERQFALVAMEDVIWSSAKAQEMEDRGVIRQHEIRVRAIDEADLDPEIRTWLVTLRGVLNRPAFRHALASRYHAIRRVRLLPVDVAIAAGNQEQGLPLAMFLRPTSHCPPGESRIGIRVRDENLRALARLGCPGCLQFVPVLAESISAYAHGTFVLQTDTQLGLAHTPSMLLDRMGCADRLIDVALSEASKIIEGGDEPAEGGLDELVIL
jgi:hypothetical protein